MTGGAGVHAGGGGWCCCTRGADGALAPQRDGLGVTVAGTDAVVVVLERNELVPLAAERLELPSGFFLNSFNNLSRLEYVVGPHENPFG